MVVVLVVVAAAAVVLVAASVVVVVVVVVRNVFVTNLKKYRQPTTNLPLICHHPPHYPLPPPTAALCV